MLDVSRAKVRNEKLWKIEFVTKVLMNGLHERFTSSLVSEERICNTFLGPYGTLNDLDLALSSQKVTIPIYCITWITYPE